MSRGSDAVIRVSGQGAGAKAWPDGAAGTAAAGPCRPQERPALLGGSPGCRLLLAADSWRNFKLPVAQSVFLICECLK